MRLFAAIALFGSFVSIANLQAQSLAEHAAAAAGATIGTAAGKPISNAVTKIFGQTEDHTRAASTAGVKRAEPEKPSPAGPAATATGGAQTPDAPPATASTGSSATSTTDELTEPASSARRSRAESRRTAARLRRQRESAAAIDPTATLPAPVAAPIPVEPVVKEPTAEEVAGIQIGASDRDVLAALGTPASRVTIPDDDGHLRESFQYWAKGSQIGTVRLDNGYVVKVEARRF